MKSRYLLSLCFVLILVFGLSCKKRESLEGHWRAVWMTSGGEVPVDLFIKRAETGDLEAEVQNDTEVVKFDRVKQVDRHLNFYYDRYECVISADLNEKGNSMSGTWAKNTGGPAKTPFSAKKGELERFPEKTYKPLEGTAVIQDVSGTWKFQFEGDDYISVGIFKQEGDHVTGTIRAIDGDFRYLEGVYRNGLLLLSCFNGSWAFLFRGELDENGIMNGYWARGPKDPYPWKATKEEADLPDPLSLTQTVIPESPFRFAYPSAEDPEEIITHENSEFQGKPLLVCLSMTGCPNSHDNADLLSMLYKEYHEKGLNIVSIHSELIKDVERIQKRIRRFKKEHDIEFPILFSFAMGKKEFADELPDLERLLAWPTVVFVGADGIVKTIYTGVEGPATGIHHENMIQKYREIIEDMLAPKPSVE